VLQGLCLGRTTQTQNNKNTPILAARGLRTHDPGVRLLQDSTRLIPRGHSVYEFYYGKTQNTILERIKKKLNMTNM
jgi:hypothetical protein